MSSELMSTLTALVDLARAATRAGRSSDAENVWRQILAINIESLDVLLSLSIQAIGDQQPHIALDFLRRALTINPKNPTIHLYIALANKELGDTISESRAISDALSIDPYFYPALMHKGMLLERLGKHRSAAVVFKDVLKIMPSFDKLSPGFQGAAREAAAAVERNKDALEHYLNASLKDILDNHSDNELGRFQRTLQVMIGRKRIYSPEPLMLHYAELPPLQFHDNAAFPWIKDLEAATDTIRDELLALLASEREKFSPYVQYEPGIPVNQWHELNHSRRWNSYFLWRGGERIDDHCLRCPQTVALIESLPVAHIPNFSPSVMFSCLEPHSNIPPHTGETNARLVVHLPLIVPKNCSFRVGSETREWVEGSAFVFDDSIEHEARNDSDEERVVLIFDIWNPHLSKTERDLVSQLLVSTRDYYHSGA